IVVPLIALGLVLGGLVAGPRRHLVRTLSTAFGASGVAAVLHVPWAIGFVLPGSQWSALGGVQSQTAPLSPAGLPPFPTGPIGGGALGLTFLVVAALPLLIGREWRLQWAARAWTLAITCWVAAWVAAQPWFGHALGPPEALLAPAAVALAFSAALGVVAFE